MSDKTLIVNGIGNIACSMPFPRLNPQSEWPFPGAAGAAPADTLTGRIDGVVNVKRTLQALAFKKVEDEKLEVELAAAEADRLEAEREARAKAHYEEVGFGSWG